MGGRIHLNSELAGSIGLHTRTRLRVVAGPEYSTLTLPVVEPFLTMQERIGSEAVMQPYDNGQICGDPMNGRKRSRPLIAG